VAFGVEKIINSAANVNSVRNVFQMLVIINADPGGLAVLRRESAAARLLGLRVRIPPGAWMSVSCECCMLVQLEASATGRSLV
jgi:hypothetical protein